MADPRWIEAGRPFTPWDGREARLHLRARELASQPALEPRHDIRKGHGTMVIAEQLLCGAE